MIIRWAEGRPTLGPTLGGWLRFYGVGYETHLVPDTYLGRRSTVYGGLADPWRGADSFGGGAGAFPRVRTLRHLLSSCRLGPDRAGDGARRSANPTNGPGNGDRQSGPRRRVVRLA